MNFAIRNLDRVALPINRDLRLCWRSGYINTECQLKSAKCVITLYISRLTENAEPETGITDISMFFISILCILYFSAYARNRLNLTIRMEIRIAKKIC